MVQVEKSSLHQVKPHAAPEGATHAFRCDEHQVGLAFVVKAGRVVRFVGEDPRRCPDALAAVVRACAGTVGGRALFHDWASDVAEKLAESFGSHAKPNAHRTSEAPGERVTRLGQTPVSEPSNEAWEGVSQDDFPLKTANLQSCSGSPDERRRLGARCACGADRFGDCELCEHDAPGKSSLAFARWARYGQPGDVSSAGDGDGSSMRSFTRCACSCHEGGKALPCRNCEHEDAASCLGIKARHALSGVHGLDAANRLRKPRKAEDGEIVRLLGIDEPRGPLVDPLEEGPAREAQLEEAMRRRRLGATGANSDGERGTGRISKPCGPQRSGRLSLCACDCHTPGWIKKPGKRRAKFCGKGCRCRKLRNKWRAALKANGTIKLSPGSPGDASPLERVTVVGGRKLLPLVRCACADFGQGAGRARQKPETIEKKRRRECAGNAPERCVVPDPCACACHVDGCCVRDDATRMSHRDRGTMFGGCSCGEHDAQACSIAERGPRVLACKADTVHWSVKAELGKDFLELLEKKREAVQADRSAEVTVELPGLEGVLWHMTPKGAGSIYRYKLTSEYADLAISRVPCSWEVGNPIYPLRFEVRSWFLWEQELEGAWSWCYAIAQKLNVAERAPRAHLTRLDMAVDVLGVDFASAVKEHFVMRATRRTRHAGRADQGDSCPICAGTGVCTGCVGTGILERAQGAEIQVEEYASGLVTSGFSFGSGGIVCRVYDKTREIRQKSRGKMWLYDYWSARGWVSTEVVWRVEVQIRRETINELVGERTQQALRLDELDGLRGALSSLWQYAVGGRRGHAAWIKWTIPNPEDSRRSRWVPRPEWKVVQVADWMRPVIEPGIGALEAEPFLLRRAKKHAAKFSQLLPQYVGLLRSMAALTGRRATRQLVELGRELIRETPNEPTGADFEADVSGYLRVRGKSWVEEVGERRVELNALKAASFAEHLKKQASVAFAERERRDARLGWSRLPSSGSTAAPEKTRTRKGVDANASSVLA